MYNEALVTMYSGFNPDSFWDPALYRVALEALAAKRDHARDSNNDNIQHDNNNRSKSKDGSNRCRTPDSNDCWKEGAMTAPAVAAVPMATTMIPTTVKDSLAVKSEEKLECGLATVNRENRFSTSEAPLSSLTLADARMRMRKTVSFADESVTNNIDNDAVVMELRNILAEQANVIEELSRLLDEDEDEND